MKDSKGDETEYAHDTKIAYCKYKASDVYDEKTLTDFANDLPKMIKKGEIDWKYKKIPTYNTMANKWFKRWKWLKCSEKFIKDITNGHKEEAILIYYKKLLSDTIADFKLIDSHRERINFLKGREKMNGEDWTYKIVKLEEAMDSIWRRIVERLGVDKEDAQEDTTSIIQPIENPPWENREELAEKRKILWGVMPPRGGKQ